MKPADLTELFRVQLDATSKIKQPAEGDYMHGEVPSKSKLLFYYLYEYKFTKGVALPDVKVTLMKVFSAPEELAKLAKTHQVARAAIFFGGPGGTIVGHTFPRLERV